MVMTRENEVLGRSTAKRGERSCETAPENKEELKRQEERERKPTNSST